MNVRQVTYTSPKFATGTKSDATELTGVRALYATSAGNLVCDDQDGNTNVTFPVVAGQQVNIQPLRVKDASTATFNLLY